MKLKEWLNSAFLLDKKVNEKMNEIKRRMGSNMPDTWSEYWNDHPEEWYELEIAAGEIFTEDWKRVTDLPCRELICLANRYIYAGHEDDGSEIHHWENFIKAGGSEALFSFMRKKELLDD